MISVNAHAVTILSGPFFAKAANAPLAGVVQLTTDVDTRISVFVTDGTTSWGRNFYDFGKVHSVPLLGFKPGRTNLITVAAHDKSKRQVFAPQRLVFVTDPLPSFFPNLTLLQSQPDKMEPGYTLFHVASTGNYHIIVDRSGQVVWYTTTPVQAYVDVRQLDNGDLFYFSTTSFIEMNALGETVRTWDAPDDWPINIHDGVPTSHGTILYLSDTSEVVSNYPTSLTNSNAPLTTATLVYQKVVEISATNSQLLNLWSPMDVLDPRRITYLTSLGPSWDAEHANAIIEDPNDNSLIVSLRDQNAVVKISRATGQLIWILGCPANWAAPWKPYLLSQENLAFGWPYGQHSPVLTPSGTLMLFDNGNYRASPFDPPVPDTNNYSRAVEYQIDESTREISQVWEYGTYITERLFTDKVGNAEPLPQTGNVLVTFGSVKYVNGVPPSSLGPLATMARLKEVTHAPVPEVVFDLAVTEYDNPKVHGACYVYRSHHLADLYPHPPAAVADLTITFARAMAHLEFSADPVRTYTVEVSQDLSHWEEIGTASPGAEPGTMKFNDTDAAGSRARYYRVVTH